MGRSLTTPGGSPTLKWTNAESTVEIGQKYPYERE